MRGIKVAKFFSLLTTLLFSGQVMSADMTNGIEYLTENFPPYNFQDETKKVATGMNVDILTAVFKEMGSGKTFRDIQVGSWANFLNAVQDPRNRNMLFSTTRTPAREALFKWVGPLSEATNAILVLKKNADRVKISAPADYSKYKFGVIRDDVGEAKLKEANVPDENITRFASFEPMFKSFQAGRFDAMSYSETVARWLIKQAGASNDEVVTAFSVVTGQHFFAFNKSIGDDVIAAHQNALNTVKANTKLMQELNDKYLK